MTTTPENPCLDCGACCAAFRVSFYWAEADDAPRGGVPVGATERLNHYLRNMIGTNCNTPHCAMLAGGVPGGRCTIYAHRPSPCRDLVPYLSGGAPHPQCQKARAVHGLAALTLLVGLEQQEE